MRRTSIHLFPLLVPGLLALLGAFSPDARAAPAGDDDPGPAGGTSAAAPADLSIRDHTVSVVLNNGFATTTIDQTLTNPRDVAVEARWAFPLPEQAALSELSIDIDGRRVIGEVVEKERAQRIYRDEKQAGESAALAERDSYFEYRVSLSRVPAHGEVSARVVYYQRLDIESGVGRYLYPLDEGNTREGMETSFWTMEEKAHGALRFDVTLKTSFPVDGLHCPSHPGFTATQVDETTWTGRYVSPAAALDRDFVLFYRLREDVPARVELITHRRPGDAEGTFLAVVTPGADLRPITEGRDWVFVLDVSGSMRGEKLRLLTRGVARALDGLGAGDRFRVIAFNDQPRRLDSAWTPAGSDDARARARAVTQLEAGGGTNIFDALELACDGLDADRTAAVVLVSDGVANTGPHEYRDFLAQAARHDVRLFTFLVGNSANSRLLGDLATVSGGFAKSISVREEIGAQLMLAGDRMGHEAMHDVSFSLDGASVVHPARLSNLYLGQQLTVFGRYDRAGESVLKVRARISGEPREWTLAVTLPEVDESNPEIERLYAMEAIADLEREQWLTQVPDGEGRSALVDLAVRYSLVTDYTSMVVVDDTRKERYGLGDDNSRRRATEQAAAERRTQQGNAVRVVQGDRPLGGGRAAHAPSRARDRGSDGGRSGGGAIHPLTLLPLAGLWFLARRRRRGGGAA